MSFKLIATGTVTGSAADIQFSNIPQTYTDLYVTITAAGRLTSGVTGAIVAYTFTSQSSTLADWRDLRVNGSSVSSNGSAYPIIGTLEYLSSDMFSSIHMYIPGYKTNSGKQVFISDNVSVNNTSTALNSFNSLFIDVPAPISFLGFGDGSAGGGLKVGSKISIYGIRNS